MHPEFGTWDVLMLWHLGSSSNFGPTKYKKRGERSKGVDSGIRTHALSDQNLNLAP